MTDDAWRAIPGTTWRDRAPANLVDTLTGPWGEPCFTPTDRRWLWRIESFLMICGTTDWHKHMRQDLLEYLRETCEHHWSIYISTVDDYIGSHRQCLWCNDVEWGEFE